MTIPLHCLVEMAVINVTQWGINKDVQMNGSRQAVIDLKVLSEDIKVYTVKPFYDKTIYTCRINALSN